MHDPRIGRFFAVDPIAGQYSYNSPYAFSENRVIDVIELEGLEITTHYYNVYYGPDGAKNVKKSHTTTKKHDSKVIERRVYRYFDANGKVTKTKVQIISSFNKIKIDENQRKIGNSDYEGIVQNATQEDYDENPVTAVLKDVSADVWNTFFDPVQEGVATITDPNTSASEKVEAGVIVITTLPSSRAARRSVMRSQKIPTSQQPKSQQKNSSGMSYDYEVPKPGGGTEIKSVQQKTKDRGHEETPHWEAGSQKKNQQIDQYGNKRLRSDKSKQEYDPKK